MSINIGDTVRFLREKGGGKVSGFRKGGFILVEDEDGFEIPMLEGDLVVIPDSGSTSQAKAQTSAISAQNSTSGPLPCPPTKGGSGINQLVTTAKVAQQEALEERVARLEHMVQKLTRRIEEMEAANLLRAHARIPQAEAGNTARAGKKPAKDEVIEVDLHAHALLDCTDGLSATEIKDYQMKVFREKMNEYLRDKGRRIVFIHGNGDGVLRKAILTEMKYSYKTCRHQDASFQQYGFGATMVTIG